MRIRTIKPEFWDSPDVGDVTRDARLTFIGLWSLADDHGRVEVVPVALAGKLFPYDDDVTPDLLCSWVNELARQGMVRLYCQGRRAYLHITAWDKHQRIDRPSKPRCPDPDDCRDLDTVSPTISRDLGRPNPSPTLFVTPPSCDSRESVATPQRTERWTVGALDRRSETLVAADAGDEESPPFEDFWDAYPRHRDNGKPGGGAARKKAEALFDKLPAAERAALLVGARHYAVDVLARDAPPKHATTFINERHWEDWQEPAIVRARGRPAHAASDANDADRYDATKWD